ncbi:MauE/DoxX family redox-associated membrane protein [Streptomyces sp. NPDC127068]|uniref:MauE/DoxX family redox-associated membrane protein n=1 Tax=Streptomyces sp. NPDC127068 TaxID=3347127 RepID=UPI0036482306
MHYLALAARLLLILVFVATAVGKSRRRASFDAFVASLSALRLFPRRLSTPVAVATIAAEAVVVVLLAVPATAGSGFALSIALLAVFIAGILAARRGGRQVPCRCFGGSTAGPLGVPHVIRNLLLAAVAAMGLVAEALTGASVAPHPGGVVIAALAAAVAALLVVRMDDLLLALAPNPRRPPGSPAGRPGRPVGRSTR